MYSHQAFGFRSILQLGNGVYSTHSLVILHIIVRSVDLSRLQRKKGFRFEPFYPNLLYKSN